ncbi:MAG: hypothetical protein JEZ11_07155 [Desulfobacterales bacterium]|nr:hypothetical protein [Desulfobacterales bacterium]
MEDLTVFRISGAFDREELIQAIIECSEKGFTKYKIYDVLGDNEIPFSADDVNKMADFIIDFSRKENIEEKTAIVVSRDIDFGNARMLMALTNPDIPHEMGVFRSIEGAYEWLELSPPPVPPKSNS